MVRPRYYHSSKNSQTNEWQRIKWYGSEITPMVAPTFLDKINLFIARLVRVTS